MASTTAPVEADDRYGPVHSSEPGSAGHVLELLRSTGGLTRAEILEATGLARSTVSARLATLTSAGLITTDSTATTSRGRPPSQFRFREDSGALLLADGGATGVRIALTDLAGVVSREATLALDVTVGPEPWLSAVTEGFEELLTAEKEDRSFVRGIGLSLPGPVDFASGTVVHPPIMTGWNGYPIRSWFDRTFGCPVIVDKDANVMATGEFEAAATQFSSMLLLKVGTGVGAGLIINGSIHRGEAGAAGDLGHIQITAHREGDVPRCRCGNSGCLEAYAGGWALLRDLRAQGRDIATVAEVVALIQSGDPLATTMAREAGRSIGIALADAVSMLNPGFVVIGGEVGDAAANLVAGIREIVYARSLPLATRELEIVPARLGRAAGLKGLSSTLTSHLYEPARVDAMVGSA